MGLKVIGTGQGRTGTTSLKIALEQLGFGKCYHMWELMNNPNELIYFQKAERGENGDWDELFKGYNSACDYPVIRYYKQVLEKYLAPRSLLQIKKQRHRYPYVCDYGCK